MGKWRHSSTILASTLDGDEWSDSRPCRFNPGERASGGRRGTTGSRDVFYLVRPGVIYARIIGQQESVIGQSSRKIVIGRSPDSTDRDKRRQFQEKQSTVESGVPVAVARGQFGNPGRGTPAVESRYQRTGEGQQTKWAQCVCNELRTVIIKWR
jgi:hypothetical protein